MFLLKKCVVKNRKTQLVKVIISIFSSCNFLLGLIYMNMHCNTFSSSYN